MRKKNRRLITLILILIIAVVAAVFFLYYMIAGDADLEEAKRALEEVTQNQDEEEANEQARLDKIAEEKSQWYLILVNNYNAMPDDFDIETVEVEDGYYIDARVHDALQEMLSDCRKRVSISCPPFSYMNFARAFIAAYCSSSLCFASS